MFSLSSSIFYPLKTETIVLAIFNLLSASAFRMDKLRILFRHLFTPCLISVSKATDGNLPDKETSVTGGYFQAGKPGSGREKRTLQSVKTHFFVGTEVKYKLLHLCAGS